MVSRTLIRTLITGGARSGKSAHAEKLAAATGKEVIYLATAQARDVEMQARIAQHRQQRNTTWHTIEEPLALGAMIRHWSAPDRVVLVDCLTVWLSNGLFSQAQDFPDIGVIDAPALFLQEREQLFAALDAAAGDVILVSNEVGLGIIPQGAVSRWFVDEAGRLNQAVAARCEQVMLVVAGLPLRLKG